ncbi:Cytochrome P450 [Mycena venus]|uniref:Cytochrome P450 n=1 Tax=Mycena venus TaxID=2733690 RepID=A0A8H6YK71_9AGAR|nr:Cytochrome P450 [Mycena venus]
MIIFAGTDTTSAALNKIFHLLALHPDVQEKLRAEVVAASECLNYNTLVGLLYLDAVLHEVLRLLVPQVLTGRFCTVPKGTFSYLATAAANRNKDVWSEDALEFKPERWESGKVDSAMKSKICGVYGNTVTFLGGARSCV